MSAISTSSLSEREAPSRVLARRRSPAHLALLIALAVVVAGSIAWWASKSPVFRLRTLSVSGAHHLSSAQVEELARLSSRTNVLWLSAGAVEQRLEGSSPWISSAKVVRALPGTVRISIVERKPAAEIESGGRRYLVASDGMVLGTASGAVKGLPAVTVVGALPKAGRALSPLPATVAAAGALSPRVRAMVGKAATRRDGNLTLTLRSGAVVEWGDSRMAQEKAQVLGSLLAWARRHGVRPAVLDVRAPSTPALLPVGAPAGAWAKPGG